MLMCSRCSKGIRHGDECLRAHPNEWTHKKCCAAEHEGEEPAPRTYYGLVWGVRNDDQRYVEAPYTEKEAMERRAWLWDNGSADTIEMIEYNGTRSKVFQVRTDAKLESES